jgi:hypothetical protein
MNALVLYVPPELAPELRQQVDRIVAGPRRLPGLPGSDDPGFKLPPEPAIYHPAAQQEADARRAAFARPADPQVIRLWAQTLAAGHGNAPRTEADFALWLSALIFTCGDDVPAVVWDAVTLRQASRTFKRYWPNAGEVFELLEARATLLKAEIEALDRIAKGQPERQGPAREAFGYDPGPAHTLPCQEGRGRSTGLTVPRKSQQTEAKADVEELEKQNESQRAQLAALAAMGIDITYQRPVASSSPEPRGAISSETTDKGPLGNVIAAPRRRIAPRRRKAVG